MKKYNEWFLGHQVSPYGCEMGYVDYRTLAECFEIVRVNRITKLHEFYELQLVNGEYESSEEHPVEIYQFFIIPEYGYEILQEFTNEIVFYIEELDMYIWGITHFGTKWDHVLTDIKLEEGVFYEK